MIKIAAAFLAVLLLAGVVMAAGLGYESITVANTAIGFTASKITAPTFAATCRLETGQIRFRVDGSDPTSSEGTILEIGEVITLTNGVEISQFRAIRTGSTSGVLKCSYR